MKSLPDAPRDADLEALLHAIHHDDRVAVKALLQKEPRLANGLVRTPRLYQEKILHWLYAKDTPLHLAAAGHRVAIARMLLAAGADPTAAFNHRRGTPLHYAADGSVASPSFHPELQVQTLRLLLKAGAVLQAADKNGATALHRAVRTRCAAAVEFLLQAGADPTARNHSGATPFHLAVQNTGRGGSGDEVAKAAQRRIIQSLLAHGVSPAMQDDRGKTVLAWATSDWVKAAVSGAGE